MKELVIDGSFENINLSIFDDKKLIYDLFLTPQDRYSKILTDVFACALKELSIKLNDIDKVYCCIGPGRYTSLRVTLATIKGIFFNKADYIYGVSSLDLMSLSENMDSYDTFRVVCKTSQTKTYFADYKKSGEALKRVSEILCSIEKEALDTPNKKIFRPNVSLTKNIFKIDSQYIEQIKLNELSPIY